MQNEENAVLGMPDIGAPQETPIEKPKDKPKDKKAEDEIFEQMMFSPSATDADTTVTLDTTTDESESEAEERKKFKNNTSKELLKILEKGDDTQLSDKYKKELLDKALKDPASVEVNTPQGWMTVRDAIDQGFNLATGQFDQEPIEKPDWEGEISKLDPREQETIRRLTQRNTPQAGPRPMMPQGTQPSSGEASLEEGGINPRPDVANPEAPVSEAGMEAGSAPQIPLGM